MKKDKYDDLTRKNYTIKEISSDSIDVISQKESRKVALLIKDKIDDAILSEIGEHVKRNQETRIFNLKKI